MAKKKFEWVLNSCTKDWDAFYDKEHLGYLDYYPKWKKYVWNQKEDIIMSLSCQLEVAKKTAELEGIDLIEAIKQIL